ncbi:FCD domain-containing protein [Streptomyces sp. NPDC048664]|uniref:FadR/GntR family transcriptional regulator n=1 Tax=Streptomyces sp. NPDC048664 TaxID=3154505 RepID=UPI0034266274
MRRMVQEPGDRRGSERRISGRIQREVMRFILDRKLRPGDPLPTESELMADLGVGRGSVRRALEALTALDIVEVRHGYGTYVGQAALSPSGDGLTFRALARPDDAVGALDEILQVRAVVEEELIRRVAVTLSDAELDRLDAVVARMEAAGREGRAFPELDREFHALLYGSLGDALVPRLLGAFWAVFRRAARAHDWPDGTAPALTARRHRAIVTALRSRDEERAERAMADHFRGIEARAAGEREGAAHPNE